MENNSHIYTLNNHNKTIEYLKIKIINSPVEGINGKIGDLICYIYDNLGRSLVNINGILYKVPKDRIKFIDDNPFK